MNDFLQLVFSGLATGSIYALAALGFTLLWQASGTINFATGEFVMLPAFIMLGLMSAGLPLPASFLLTIVISAVVLGWGFKKALVDPLIRHGIMPLIVATIGLSMLMRNAIRAGVSAEAHPFPNIFGDKIFNLFGVTITAGDLGTLVFALIVVLGLQAFLQKTITGRAMQAVAQNTESATVLGINVNRMVLYTFVINAALATVAALLVTPVYLAKFEMGVSLGLKAFLAAIIGGFNNSRGALVGGLIVGVCENLAGAYISPAYKDGVALALFMVIILFKPNGLFGRVEMRKV
ncbi:branched-chain amino acid ABC transporter permease [Noviherbaspirillum denitrificans]|uniref:ABC transporter permease n=1 Tax=Noviherbaspirillum denitrificans TaxID=1968433 RepID=A0A254TFT2_9BURK|nr:branched-chain amino acid ABC transporter permease [Noviherbaspirillum denitrificans]OWW20182.1 ABC transporter permease [Noviherbaspirillum denitrificans]